MINFLFTAFGLITCLENEKQSYLGILATFGKIMYTNVFQLSRCGFYNHR